MTHIQALKRDEAAPLYGLMQQAALEYARINWPIFPCHTMQGGVCSCGKPDCIRPAKHPRTKNGLNDATTDMAQINDWWEKWPDANIALAVPPGLAVLDVDTKPHEGKYGDQTLAGLETLHGSLPETVRSLTGGGGVQFFFKTDVSLPCLNGLFDSIDLKTHGGYVILPPSLHASGRRYRWDDGHAPEGVSEWS